MIFIIYTKSHKATKNEMYKVNKEKNRLGDKKLSRWSIRQTYTSNLWCNFFIIYRKSHKASLNELYKVNKVCMYADSINTQNLQKSQFPTCFAFKVRCHFVLNSSQSSYVLNLCRSNWTWSVLWNCCCGKVHVIVKKKVLLVGIKI